MGEARRQPRRKPLRVRTFRRIPAGLGPVRTYQDLLTSAHDEQLFEHYFAAQLAFVDAASGKRTPVGKPGMRAQPPRLMANTFS